MNIDENYRKLKKIENVSIRLYLQKYSLINKLNSLHIKQHYIIIELFLDFNLGTSLESEYEI